MAQDTNVPVRAVKTNFEIVEGLRELDGGGVSELASYLGVPKSTVHDHLQTLEHGEYVVKDDGTYRLGARFLELGGHARSRMNIYRIAEPEIQVLAAKTGEHANLMIEEHGRGIFLYKAKGDNAVHLDTHAGMRVYLQTTAMGKAILAHLPDERVEAILDRHGMPQVTENTVTDREELDTELVAIRERGYATDDGERVEGMRCLAAPIRSDDGGVLGAVSVSGPTSRMQGNLFEEELPNLVLSTANVIEVNVKYS